MNVDRYITQNDTMENGFDKKPIKFTMDEIMNVASNNNSKEILVFVPTKKDYNNSLLEETINEYAADTKITYIFRVESQKTINHQNLANIILSYFPNEHMISFLGAITFDSSVFVVPYQMDDVFDCIENLKPYIIDSHGNINKKHDISTHGKIIKEISNRVGRNASATNAGYISERLYEMIEMGIRPKKERIVNTAICFGWGVKQAKKLGDLYEGL